MGVFLGLGFRKPLNFRNKIRGGIKAICSKLGLFNQVEIKYTGFDKLFISEFGGL
tara:strand:+ start:456 stop:620 length:165 start_codon:yes stop_codon:yes gene_type:complete